MTKPLHKLGPITWLRASSWRHFACVFAGVLFSILGATYLFILVSDPYGLIAPLHDNVLQYGNQRTLYPQIVRSRRFNAFIIGTSTSRLLDPDIFNAAFGARFANLAMNSMLAWEQKTMMELILREVPAPKALIIGLDGVWCVPDADTHRFLKEGFPDWLYDDVRWNDYLNLLNVPTLKIAVRQLAYRFGLVSANVADTGFGVFVPPESQYDAERVRKEIWGRMPPPFSAFVSAPPHAPRLPHPMPNFPALPWLDAILSRLPESTIKVLAYMPVHVTAQPALGSAAEQQEAACKARIADIARTRGAIVVDWRIPSKLTYEYSNYWDRLHVRLPVAHRVARDIAAAVLEHREAADGSYRLLLPAQ